MAEIVNLRRVRRAAAREAEARDAEVNRRRFGRTAVEKTRDADEAARRDAVLDGARLEPEGPAET